MGLFARKIPASDGLSLVAASTALTVLERLQMSHDAVRIAAYVVGYVHNQRDAFGIPAAALERLTEFTLAILAQNRPDLHPYSMVYVVSAGVSIRIFSEQAAGSTSERFYEMLPDWELSFPDFLAVTEPFLGAANDMLVRRGASWKKGC